MSEVTTESAVPTAEASAAPVTANPPSTEQVAEAPSLLAEAPKTEAEAEPKIEGDDKSLLETAPVERVTKDTTFKFPEGVEVNDEVMGKFKTLAETAGITTNVAQELLDIYASDVRKIADDLAADQSKVYLEMRTAWRKEIEADPMFSGAASAATMTSIGRAFDEYGSAEAREAFTLTGAGDNPHIARFVANMAKALSEGGPVRAGGPVAAKPKGAAALYTNGGAGPTNSSERT